MIDKKVSILNHWTDPFWREFTKIPFQNTFLDGDEENETESIHVARVGCEICVNIYGAGAQYLGYFDANSLAIALSRAVEDVRKVEVEQAHYFREKSDEILKQRYANLPQALMKLDDFTQSVAEDVKKLQQLNSNNEDAASLDLAKNLQKRINNLSSNLDLLQDVLKHHLKSSS